MNSMIDIQWYINEGYGNPFELEPNIDAPLIINAALTGMVPSRKDSPHVPLTPEEIINDAERCYKAGASIIHLHARDEKGEPTYKSDSYKEVIPEIKKRCNGVIICITTSGRKFSSFEHRSEVLSLNSGAKPEMATLTLGSMNFPKQASVNSPEIIKQLASKMIEKSIRPELEVFEPGMINYAKHLKRKGFLKGKHLFNVFLGSLGTMPASLKGLDFMIQSLPEGAVWAAAGIGKYQLPISIASIIKGGHVRVGLEDNLYFDHDKKILATNEMLVKRLASFASSIGRKIATTKETRRILSI